MPIFGVTTKSYRETETHFMSTELELLRVEGFRRVGHMAPSRAGCRRRMASKLPKTPGCYAWVQDGKVLYVGKAETDVNHRTWTYGYDFDRVYKNGLRPV